MSQVIFLYLIYNLLAKKYESGDGVFFQLMMIFGIWTVGLIVNLIRTQEVGNIKFYPLCINFTKLIFIKYLGLLGGFIWATGNIICRILKI